MLTPDPIRPLLDDLPMTAASFIVTIYGDVVVPRGGVLWMGSLIEICGRVGIRENLVRTAVSRLVAAGRLTGERKGRRSFYRLTPDTQAEFSRVAGQLYARSIATEGWFLLQGAPPADDVQRRLRMARLGGDVWLCPDLGEAPPAPALRLPLQDAPPEALRGFAAAWNLEEVQARYDRMLARFAPFQAAMQTGDLPDGFSALIARLLLVHVFRAVLLRDPCLPPQALPPGWSGTGARQLFRTLYPPLSAPAEQVIGSLLEGPDGHLPARTSESDRRLRQL